VLGTTRLATSAYSDSRQTSVVAPESARISSSSRSLSIGLIDTMIAPIFQLASIVSTNCGTFWR
jgi:hypothetical protein